jgi:hypothetical protein
MTPRRQEVIEQLCKMMGRVWQTIDPDAHNACDCVCKDTGRDYRNSGEALEFMERVISEAIAAHEQRRDSIREVVIDSDDYLKDPAWATREAERVGRAVVKDKDGSVRLVINSHRATEGLLAQSPAETAAAEQWAFIEAVNGSTER